MSVCRLCLNRFEGPGVSIVGSETTKKLRKFLPRVHNALRRTQMICDICTDNIATAEQLQNSSIQTETNIQEQLKRLQVAKINLRGFHKNVCNNISVCRICLKLVDVPKIFLCANNTNILWHEIIIHMLKFCNIHVNVNLSDRPVMCTNCWENLQIMYTFKKCYLEVETKVTLFCQEFKLLKKNVSPEILQRIHNYYNSEDYCEMTSCNQAINIKKEENPKEDYYVYMFPKVKKEPCIYKMSSPVKTSKCEMRYVKNESCRYSATIIPPKIIKFNKKDNFTLMRVYYEVTDNERNFPAGYWKAIADKWEERMPKRKIPLEKLGAQINKVFTRELLSEADLAEIKRDVEQRLVRYSCANTQTYNTSQILTHEQQVQEPFDFQEDSDDSFVEDVNHPSFTPIIKSEILNESDIEFNSIETKLEVESDCESIPQLERMDIPPMNFKIENICSLEVKREAFDQYMRQEEEMHMDDEDVNRTRRSGRVHGRSGDQNGDIIKCGECNFETRIRWSADRHRMYHQRGRHNMRQCPRCPYRISSRWSFNKHMRTHEIEEDDIPVLEPFMIPID